MKSNLAKADIRTVFCLVREFLEYFELDFTNSVFEKESFMGILYDYKGKERLIKDLEIGVENVTQTPLLVEVLNIARNTYKFNNKINETVQNMSYINDSKDVINSTYDVPSKNNNSCIDELDSFKNESVSKSSSKNIDIKTVPKTTSQSNDSTSSVDSENSNIQNISTTPNVNSQNTGKDQKNIEPQKLETDDTYEGTSSIAEDSITSNKETPLIDFDKTGNYTKLIINFY